MLHCLYHNDTTVDLSLVGVCGVVDLIIARLIRWKESSGSDSILSDIWNIVCAFVDLQLNCGDWRERAA